MNKMYSLMLRPVFAFLYVLGLSFIIPFLLAINLPQDLPEELVIKYGSNYFLTTSIVLLSIAIIGTFMIKEEFSKTLKSLAYYSLIPGILSLLITLFGKDFLINFFVGYNQAFVPIVTSYINSRVPKLWFLTLAYILLGIIFYYIGRKIQ